MGSMISRLLSVIRPPVFESEEKTRAVRITAQAQLAYLVAWVMTIVPLIYAACNAGTYLRLATGEGPLPLTELVAVLVVSAVSFLLVFLIRRGAVRLSSIVLVILVWSGFAFLGYNGGIHHRFGGIGDPGYAGFIIAIVMAGLLLGAPAAIVTAVLSVLAGWILVDAELRGALPVHITGPVDAADAVGATAIVVNYLLLSLLATGLVCVANRGLRTLLKRLQTSVRDLRARNRQLQQMRDSLEGRVAEQTADLDRRTRYLEAAARVAYAAGEIQDADQLMRESVNQIRETFGLYYVGFFVLDGRREWAVLRAGTGEAGAQMLARGHRIRVGSGMIGWCVAHGESRVAQHTAEDEVRLVAPELPGTRSEAALPLRARGRVLGALTVQSEQPGFFDAATVTVLQTMADLLAVALSNAFLYEESQKSMAVHATAAAARRAYGEIVSEAWDELLSSRGSWGYRYADGTLLRSEGEPDPAIQRAIDSASLVEVQQEGTSSVALPLRIGGRVVGAVKYQRWEDEAGTHHRSAGAHHRGGWDPEDIVLLSTLTDQIAQALDSARLLQDAQRSAAREQKLNDIAVQVSNAVDVETMLRAVVDELGRLPGVLEASVHLVVPDKATHEAGTDHRAGTHQQAGTHRQSTPLHRRHDAASSGAGRD